MIRKFVLFALLSGAMMAAEAKTFTIDIRTPAEIQETGRVEGSLTDDFRSPDFIEKFKAMNIAKDNEVQLYCRSGARAGRAKLMLEEMGYKNVKNLGGYEAASKTLNRPLVK